MSNPCIVHGLQPLEQLACGCLRGDRGAFVAPLAGRSQKMFQVSFHQLHGNVVVGFIETPPIEGYEVILGRVRMGEQLCDSCVIPPLAPIKS